MNKNIFGGTETKIVHYIESVFQPEDSVLKEARERSEKKGLPSIQVAKMDGLHLEIVTRATGAKKAVEIGTLGGYSGLCIARGLGKAGRLFTFEMSPLYAEVARETFKQGGVLDQVQIFVGPALENLDRIKSEGPFDLVFIDADKVNYPKYLAWAAENLRVGGVVLGDNTFAWGMIADDRFGSAEDEAATLALREFNQAIAKGGRFRATILPTGEGMTFGVKIK